MTSVLQRTIPQTALFCAVAALLMGAGCVSPAIHPPLDSPSKESRDTREPDVAAASRPALNPTPQTTVSEPDLTSVLAQPLWIRSVHSPGEPTPQFRWSYPNLQRLFSEEPPPLAAMRRLLDTADPTVAANAAIGLTRWGDLNLTTHLAQAVGNTRLDVKLRCAAAESLALAPDAPDSLCNLVDTEIRRADTLNSGYSAAVHAELVRNMAPSESRLANALANDAVEVVVAALESWRRWPRVPLPEQAMRLGGDPRSEVRAAWFETLGHCPDANTLGQLQLGLKEPELRVRTAAIRAMGHLGDPRATPALAEVLRSGTEADRIAAIEALVQLGQTEAVVCAAGDKAWRVRRVVATSLGSTAARSDVLLARRLLADVSSEVQYETIKALASWPPELARPLIIDALEQTGYRSQKAAVDILITHWPEQRPLLEAFPFGQSPSVRQEAISKLRAAFDSEAPILETGHTHQLAASAAAASRSPIIPEEVAAVERLLRGLQAASTDPILQAEVIARLRRMGPRLIDLLEYLAVDRGAVLPERIYSDVLAAELPAFEIVEQLGWDDVVQRQRAARLLDEELARRKPRPLLLRRLRRIAVTETDAAVWHHLLSALADLDDQDTFGLVYAAAGHPASSVRLAACDHLARHPHRRHTPVLVAALGDPSAPVVRTAAEALGSCGQRDDQAPLTALLASENEAIQLAAAKSLARHGWPRGTAALKRLAHTRDEQIRLRTAQAMAERADPVFAPTLVRLLGDRRGIRLAALEGLSEMTLCEEAAREGLSEAEQVEAWRRWAATPNVTPR